MSEEPSAAPAPEPPPVVAEAPAPTAPARRAASVRAPAMGKLLIAPCTTPVPLGKATLRVSGMIRKSGVYTGDYQIKVTPLFLASEKGRLSVAVSDEGLRNLAQGMPMNFNGTATTTGSGKTRTINGIATPAGKREGNMQMWFTADGKKKAFTSRYRFLEK